MDPKFFIAFGSIWVLGAGAFIAVLVLKRSIRKEREARERQK